MNVIDDDPDQVICDLRNDVIETLATVVKLRIALDGAVKTIRDWHTAAQAMRDLAVKGDCKGVERLYFDTALSLPFYGAQNEPLPSQSKDAL